jgi:hypothetical protein
MTQRIPFGRTAVVLLSAVQGAVSLIPPSSIAFAAGLAEKLVGTWLLVRYTDTDPSGKVTFPFGKNPSGYFVYDPTGHPPTKRKYSPRSRSQFRTAVGGNI